MEVKEERDGEMGRKNIWRNNPPKPSKFDEKILIYTFKKQNKCQVG